MTSATSTSVAAVTKTGAQQARQHQQQQQQRRRQHTSRGVSTLMYASQQGDVRKVRKIIRNQPSLLYDRDRTGKTPLHYTCTSDNICAAQTADLLVMAAPELVDNHDEDGFTPLHLAVIAGNMPLVTFLLANQADVNAVDNEKHTVVHWAAVCGEVAALRAVLAAGAPISTPDVHGGYPLHYAAQMCGNDKESSTNFGLDVLQTLLTHSEIVINVEDGDGRQPLLWAASAGSTKALLALIRAGAGVESPDKDGLTALHCAASRGHTDCIDSLLTLCGASPDVIDSNGCTALHYAVTLGHADATALLLVHGADPNRQDRKGRSPAHCGCAKGQFETCKMISNHGANLWLKNARGDYPLHEATGSGRRDLVRWLLEMRPSQVNARNNDGRCPLHLAALNDNADMCKILLDAGAQINPILRTSKNIFMTPLDCALQRGFRSTAKYLQLHGGVPANRLGGDIRPLGHKLTSTGNGVSKEDPKFWGSDSSSDSDSPRQQQQQAKREVLKSNRRLYRKKIPISKLERKRSSVSSSELESSNGNKSTTSGKKKSKSDGQSATNDSKRLNNNKSKSLTGRLDFTNQIVINGKTEINIHQTREIGVNGTAKTVIDERIIVPPPTTTIENETEEENLEKSRPKSAKQFRKTKSAKTKPMEEETKEKNLVEKTTQTVPETTTIVQKVEETVDKEMDGNFVEGKLKSSNLLPDQQSLMSNTSEDIEENNKKLVVEASIHEPPKNLGKSGNAVSGNENLEGSSKGEEVGIIGVNEETKKEPLEGVLDTSDDKNLNAMEERETKEETNAQLETEAGKTESIKGEEEETLVSIVQGTEQEETETKVESTNISDNKEGNEDVSKEAEAHKTTEDSQITTKPHVNGTKEEEKTEEKLVGEEEEEEEERNQKPIEEELPKTEELNSKTIETVPDDSERVVEDKELSKSKAEDLQVQENETEGNLKPTTDQETKTQDDHQRTEEMEKNLKSSKSKKEENEKYSDDFSSRSSTSDSTTTSSSVTVKEHKSFRILDETEANKMKEKPTTRRSKHKNDLLTIKQQQQRRSRSEEIKLNKLEKLNKRSKIPTPLLTRTRLSKSDKYLNLVNRKVQSSMESRVPSLPNIHESSSLKDLKFGKEQPIRSDSNMSAPLLASVINSDNERAISGSDLDDLEVERKRSSALRKRKVKKKMKTRDSHSAGGSDYDESSNVIDSGFEPSPRSSRIPKWRNMSERGVNMTSVTQSIQSNIRRYHLERKIFQHLLDLKRLQIRAGQHNEAILVKRAIDAYHQSCASTVGAGKYIPEDYTFKSFEKFLYFSLRKLQRNGADHLKGLPETSTNPLLCTKSTHRCMHATHAYTGIPCAAYLPMMDHHTIPKIGFNSTTHCKPPTNKSFLPTINPKKSVTLELCHGNDKQIISLPADRLDQNKRYYVTFTVKGNETPNDEQRSESTTTATTGHRHPRSD